MMASYDLEMNATLEFAGHIRLSSLSRVPQAYVVTRSTVGAV